MILAVEIVMNVLGQISINIGFAQPELGRPLLGDGAEVRRLQAMVPRLLKHFHQVKIAGRSIEGVESYRPESKNKGLARPFVPQVSQVIHEVLPANGYL